MFLRKANIQNDDVLKKAYENLVDEKEAECNDEDEDDESIFSESMLCNELILTSASPDYFILLKSD